MPVYHPSSVKIDKLFPQLPGMSLDIDSKSQPVALGLPSSQTLCALCHALDFKQLSIPYEGQYEPSNLSRAQLHQPNFASLVASSKTCVLCAHFLRTWIYCPGRRRNDQTDQENNERIQIYELQLDEKYSNPQKALRSLRREKAWSSSDDALSWPRAVRDGEWPPPGLEEMLGSFTVRGVIVRGLNGSQGLYGLRLQRIELLGKSLWIDELSRNWTNLSCTAEDFSWVAGRPFGAETPVALGRKWLAECSKTHTSCGHLADKKMPTRVIDVGVEGGEEPRLIETRGRSGQWVTLSYPWGGAEPITTKETYAENLEKMPVASLPPMFRDAVNVVRAMGFRYLWIDSICIIQGDAEDWARECGRMAQVYEDSAFTIAACAASSPADSLMPSGNSIDRSPCIFEKEGITFVASLDNMIENGDMSMPREQNSVISTRGWCFQERLLAPRVLYLGSRQSYWECYTCQFYEFVRVPLPLTRKSSSVFRVRHKIFRSVFARNEEFDTKIWSDMVESYSRCELTNPMDKLPALSGIAQATVRRLQATYLAGIWLYQLELGLAWFRVPNEKREIRAPPEYRAPSWSWASVDGPVQFHAPPYTPRPQFDIVSAVMTPATSDVFGRVTAGRLTLHGYIMELPLTPSMRDPSCENYDKENPQLIADYWPDQFIENARLVKSFPCLLLSGSAEFAGLALEEVDGQPHTFRRIGFVNSSSYLYKWRAAVWWRNRKLKHWTKRERQIVHLV